MKREGEARSPAFTAASPRAAHMRTPVSALGLETGCVVRMIVKARNCHVRTSSDRRTGATKNKTEA